jgi:hypothetical protein
MRYVAGVGVMLFSLMTASAVWATDDVAPGFYALRDINRAQSEATQLRMLSDVQLARVEGSAWFPWANHQIRQAQIREVVFQYFVASLLTDVFQGKTVDSTTSPIVSQIKVSQTNFLIQLNIAIGDHITQVNNAIQRNLVIINQRVH